MKQLLAVSWDMPPVLMPRSIQVTRTLNRLAELGWQTTVLCTSPKGLDKRITIDASLERVLGQAYHPVRVASLERSLPLRALERFFFLDHLVWIFRAVPRGRALLRSGNFSAIVSFAQPWASHLVGLRLHRFSGLPWVAHFSDPWVDSPYFRGTVWQRQLWRHLEAVVVREAGAVVFVNSQTADLVMSKYPPAWREKTYILPHGFDAGFFPPGNPSAGPRPRLRMVYTGRFYPGRRTPEGLFRGLQILQSNRNLSQELEIRLIGPFAPSFQTLAQELGLGQMVTCREEVPFMESVKETTAADVLLLIDAPSDTPSPFLPSKLVDYLAFRKPILGLTPREGPSSELLQQLGCPVVAPDDVADIAQALTELLDLWQAGKLAVSPAFAEVAHRYDIRQTTKILDRVLRELISRKLKTNNL
jgi:glycosyltransferase involved in cell wall biosynthesis